MSGERLYDLATAVGLMVFLGLIQGVVIVAALVEVGIWLQGRRAPRSPEARFGDTAPLMVAVWLALAAGILLVMQWVLANAGKG